MQQEEEERQRQEEQRKREEEEYKLNRKTRELDRKRRELPAEPDDGANIVVRLPDGSRLSRRFSQNDKIKVLQLVLFLFRFFVAFLFLISVTS